MLRTIPKRLFLSLVKRHLGRLLKSEPDLEQVDARLGAGTVELREALLNCDYLNEHVVNTGFKFTAGFVSRIELSVNWATLSVRLELEEVLLTVKPDGTVYTQQQPDSPASPKSLDSEPLEDDVELPLGQQVLAQWLEQIFSQLSVVVLNATVRLEGLDNTDSVLVLHFDRVAYGNFQSEQQEDDLDVVLENVPSPVATFIQIVFEGMSVDLENEDRERPPLVAIDGGNVRVTSEEVESVSFVGTVTSCNASLGHVSVHLQPDSVTDLVEAVKSVGKVAQQCQSFLSKNDEQQSAEPGRCSEYYSVDGSEMWNVDRRGGVGSLHYASDQDEFHDAESKLASSVGSVSSFWRTAVSTVSGVLAEGGGFGMSPAEQVHHTRFDFRGSIPGINVTIEYTNQEGPSSAERDHVTLVLNNVNVSGEDGDDRDMSFSVLVDSCVCYEEVYSSQKTMRPNDAKRMLDTVGLLPPELTKIVKKCGWPGRGKDQNSTVYPLFQLGFGKSTESSPCLRASIEKIQGGVDSRQKGMAVRIQSLPVVVWATCDSVRNVDRTIKNIQQGLDGVKPSVSCSGDLDDVGDAGMQRNQVQHIIDDIMRGGALRAATGQHRGRQDSEGFDFEWRVPAVFMVLELPLMVDRTPGVVFAMCSTEQKQAMARESSVPFMLVEKLNRLGGRARGTASLHGAATPGKSVVSMQFTIMEMEAFHVQWGYGRQGECSCILKACPDNSSCGSEFASIDLNQTAAAMPSTASAVSVEVELDLAASSARSMDTVAGDFVSWHAADRWADSEGCWYESEGSFEEVEFQAKCVDSAKLFVRVNVHRLVGEFGKRNLQALVDIVDYLEAEADVEEFQEQDPKDQVAILVTGQVECHFIPSPDPQSTSSSSNTPTQPYSLFIEDVGFLHTDGLAGKQIAADWAWFRGITLTGSTKKHCYVYAPLPRSSDIPAPPGIEFAQLGRLSADKANQDVSVRLKGLTFATDGDDQEMKWMHGLASYFPARQNIAAPAVKQEMAVYVNAESMGLRLEPPGSYVPVPEDKNGPVSAALLVEALHLEFMSNSASHRAVLHSLSFHLGHSNCRKADWALSNPLDLQSVQLHGEGYCCVVQEGVLKVDIGVRPSVAEAGKSEVDIEVRNQQLLGNLTQKSVGLVTLFVQQVSGVRTGATAQAEESRTGKWEIKDPDGKLCLFDEMDEDVFRRAPAVNPLMASECPEGRCFGGSGSETSEHNIIITDDWISEAPESDVSTASPTCGARNTGWYDGAPPDLQDDYVQVPLPGDKMYDQIWESSSSKGALQPPGNYPQPLFKLQFTNISAMVVLHDTTPGGMNQGRLELQIDGLNVRLDSFPDSGHYLRRTAVVVQSMELRDCASSAVDTGSTAWQVVLSRSKNRPKVGKNDNRKFPGPTAPMVEFVLDAVRPDICRKSGDNEEFRLKVAFVPLRLRLDQSVISFLEKYCAALPPPLPEDDNQDQEVMFLQHCEIAPLYMVVDYLPRSLDLEALKSGSTVEVLNLVRWGGVKLNLKGLRLAGLQGWDQLFEAVAKEWQKDIAKNQAHKFITGVPPVRSVRRIVEAVQDVLSASIDALRPPARNGLQLVRSPPSRQLSRSTLALLRVVALEALNAGASVAAGAQMVLQGTVDPSAPMTSGGTGSVTPPHQAAGVRGGLRQAGACLATAMNKLVVEPIQGLQNGERLGTVGARALRAAPAAVMAPATAAATAISCTLAGARNALDKDRTLDE